MLANQFIIFLTATAAKSPEQVGRVGHGQRLGEISIDGVINLVRQLGMLLLKKVH